MTNELSSDSIGLRVIDLHRRRPTSKLLRATSLLLAALALYAWCAGDIRMDDLFSARRVANVERFLREEVRPHPLVGKPFDAGVFFAWVRELLFAKHGAEGTAATLSISVVAISLAGALALCLAPFAARNLAARSPFEQDRSALRSGARIDPFWSSLTTITRAAMIFLRAIPEYVWAFLFLAMLGPSAWPAILALAIHNAGILGKLGAETIENLDPSAPRALRELGATRAEIGIAAVMPLALARFLLYFFYRFETCVREATVLGMLGVVSLGYWIQDARAKHFYDEMLFFVALGAIIVLLVDLLSAAARHFLRRAT
jgi:phosphonate transport system permease protein